MSFTSSSMYFLFVYGTEGEAADEAEPKTEGETAEPKAETPPPAEKAVPQSEVNRILAAERKKWEAKNRQTVQQLETLKANVTLTEKQKNELEQRIESLNDQFLSKDELAKKEQLKIEQKYSLEKESLAKERDTWRTRYQGETLQRAIQDAAVANEAYSPSQLVDMLSTKAALVEDMDEQGAMLGSFTPRVKIPSVDKDGKPMVLDLTVSEAIKHMKETPEKYGNLFKSGAQGGLGASTRPGKRTTAEDIAAMSPAEYRKLRKSNPGIIGL